MRSRKERVQGRWKILAVITGVVLVLLILLAALEGINGHRPAQDRSVTPVVALLSVGVGALLGGVVRAAVDRYASVVESKGMAVALRAEVEAILQLVEARRYLSEVTEYISRLQSPTYTPTLDDVFNIRVSQDYFVVFHALCPKIGLLGPLSGQVVRLYMVGKSLLEDIHTLREIYERARSGDDSLDREELLARSQSVASLFQVISDLGPQVVAALTAYAAHRWWRIVPKSHTRARDGECTESKHNGCHQAQPKKAKPGQRGRQRIGSSHALLDGPLRPWLRRR